MQPVRSVLGGTVSGELPPGVFPFIGRGTEAPGPRAGLPGDDFRGIRTSEKAILWDIPWDILNSQSSDELFTSAEINKIRDMFATYLTDNFL